jgi:hypothetical protein
MFKTRITELFGIEYPIVSAAMGGVSLAELAGQIMPWELPCWYASVGDIGFSLKMGQ